MIKQFVDALDQRQRELFLSLETPALIQEYLDTIPYSAEEINRCPLSVMRDKKAHCLDGAMFGATALRRLGYPPLILDMLPEPETDDDHLLAVYRKNGHWGALAKSNFVGLRYREPVYRNLRELVMSYFDVFFNVYGQKTLRGYTRPVNLERFDRSGWMWDDKGADVVENYLWKLHSIPVITPEMAAGLAPMDKRSYEAHMVGTDPLGLYKTKKG